MAILTKLSKKQFCDILENYNIGEYKSHKHIDHALANTIFFLNSTKGKFVLKIFERQKDYHIRYQLKVREYLQTHNFPISQVIPTKKGKTLLKYNNKKITIEEFAEGKHIHNVNSALAKEIGLTLGKLHNLLYKLKLPGGYFWGKNHQFKKQNHPEKFAGLKVKEESDKLLKELKTLNITKLKEAIIQSDFCSSNILVKKNKIISVIDWEDAHKDYLCFDLGICISGFFIYSKGIKKQLKPFLEGYQSMRKLNKEEKKATYYFVLRRKLGALGYLYEMKKHHKNIKTGQGSWASKFAKSYEKFKKVDIEDYLSYF